MEPKHENEEIIRKEIDRLSRRLLGLAGQVLTKAQHHIPLNRGILGELLQESMRMEEILDGFGALKNKRFFPYREDIAGIKIFSHSLYTLMHIRHSFERYSLLPINRDFIEEYPRIIEPLSKDVVRLCKRLEEQAARLRFNRVEPIEFDAPSAEGLAEKKLPADKKMRHTRNPGPSVIYLASHFLNLAGALDLPRENQDEKKLESLIPDIVSEEKLRGLETRFHNLQSLYDTHIIDSDIERQNSDLRILRGHITMIFHLLEASVTLCHYYERHILAVHLGFFERKRSVISREALLKTLLQRILPYIRQYISSAQDLCRRMIQRYAEVGSIHVPIPNYRGFHVRPSTLIARIVIHYGSDIVMRFNGQDYNAGLPLELFRVNEEINSLKRRKIGELLQGTVDDSPIGTLPSEKVMKIVRLALLKLAEEDKIALYTAKILSPEEMPALDPDQSLHGYMKLVIAFLMAAGRIDIHTDLQVEFSGDRRVLKDIEILAQNGYGEDKFGNNIVLPDPLSYLKR